MVPQGVHNWSDYLGSPHYHVTTSCSFSLGVNETTVPGTTIGRIEVMFSHGQKTFSTLCVCFFPHQAQDADAEDFGLVWYRLTVPATPLVTLEEDTGVLRLNQSLDLLQFRVSPVFTAVAFDNRGSSPSSISMNVPVMVMSSLKSRGS